MRYALFLSLTLLFACGDDRPTATTAVTTTVAPNDRSLAAGTVVTFVSGETDQPVRDAMVTVAGRSYSTDASGGVVLAERVARGGLIDVFTPDFLDRQTYVRSNEETRFALFPKRSPTGLDESFTFEILYTSARNGERLRMYRLTPGTTEAWLVPSPQIRADLVAMRFVENGAHLIGDATRGQVVFHVTESPPAGTMFFDLVVDPEGVRQEGDFVAIAQTWATAWGITGGTVRYLSMEVVRSSTTVHELGHLFGPAHSSGSCDVMNTDRDRLRVDRFSPREQLMMNLMLKRRPGNDHPDNDRQAPTQWQLGIDGSGGLTTRCSS